MVDGTSRADSGGPQETIQTEWAGPSEDAIAEYPCLSQNFYSKTKSQLSSGTSFDTRDGKQCYLFLLSTLQPVSEAKEAVVVLLPLTLLVSLLLSVLFALLYSGRITKPLSEISKMTEQMRALDPSAVCRVKTRDEI